jgi:hypothetical protein
MTAVSAPEDFWGILEHEHTLASLASGDCSTESGVATSDNEHIVYAGDVYQCPPGKLHEQSRAAMPPKSQIEELPPFQHDFSGVTLWRA